MREQLWRRLFSFSFPDDLLGPLNYSCIVGWNRHKEFTEKESSSQLLFQQSAHKKRSHGRKICQRNTNKRKKYKVFVWYTWWAKLRKDRRRPERINPNWRTGPNWPIGPNQILGNLFVFGRLSIWLTVAWGPLVVKSILEINRAALKLLQEKKTQTKCNTSKTNNLTSLFQCSIDYAPTQ